MPLPIGTSSKPWRNLLFLSFLFILALSPSTLGAGKKKNTRPVVSEADRRTQLREATKALRRKEIAEVAQGRAVNLALCLVAAVHPWGQVQGLGADLARIAGSLPPQVIPACCKPVATGDEIAKEVSLDRGEPGGDPYISGSGPVTRDEIKSVRDELFLPRSTLDELRRRLNYSYDRPKALGGRGDLESLWLNIPVKNAEESSEEYSLRRLKDLADVRASLQGTPNGVPDVTTWIGKGANSAVYAIHPPVPLEFRSEKNDPGGAKRRAWAIEHSQKVIKLRNPSPWNEGAETAARQLRRDLVLQTIYKECASKFYVNEGGVKKPLIQVIEYKNSKQEIVKGVFSQSIVRGTSAAELAFQIRLAKKGNVREKADAEEFLLHEMNFSTIAEAERKIQLLQAFYHETHNDVVGFIGQNDIDPADGKTRELKAENKGAAFTQRLVGFDYNNGLNVLWDPREKIFKAIDF